MSRFLAGILMLSLAACASGKKRSESSELIGPVELPMDAQTSGDKANAQLESDTGANMGPSPANLSPIVLILGPGMARGFVHAGVLIELEKQQIPVKAIIGVEMGSLIGAMYLNSKTTNDFEWKLTKLKAENIWQENFSFQSIFGSPDPIYNLNKHLDEVMGDSLIKDLKKPYYAVVFDEEDGDTRLIKKGKVKDWIAASMADELLYKSVEIHGKKFRSTAGIFPYPVDKTRELALGPVVVVDLFQGELTEKLSKKARVSYVNRIKEAKKKAEAELEEADILLRPELTGFSYFDFNERNKLIFKGKKIVQENVKKLRQLAGLGNAKKVSP